VHRGHLLVQVELDRLEGSARVGAVAERLLLGHAAAAPEEVFGDERFFDHVWTDLCNDREGHLVVEQASLEGLLIVLLDGDSRILL